MQGSEIVEAMMKNDFFSQWLGITILEQKTGSCKLSLTVKKEMLNGFLLLAKTDLEKHLFFKPFVMGYLTIQM